LPEASDLLLAQLALELPIPQGFADNLTGGGIFAGFDGSLERGELVACHGNIDFLDRRRGMPSKLLGENLTTRSP
jgi:hypothetical protein